MSSPNIHLANILLFRKFILDLSYVDPEWFDAGDPDRAGEGEGAGQDRARHHHDVPQLLGCSHYAVLHTGETH